VIRDRVRGPANYRERDGKTVSVLVGRKTAVIVIGKHRERGGRTNVFVTVCVACPSTIGRDARAFGLHGRIRSAALDSFCWRCSSSL
jgi:hypothetical protein